MDKNIIKEMISRQLDLIIEQFNNLNKHRGKIPQIDIDITKRNVSILYEQLFELERENSISLFDKHKEAKSVPKPVEAPPIAKIIEEPAVEIEEEEEVTFPVDTTPEPVVEEPKPSKVVHKTPEIKEPVIEFNEPPVEVKEEPQVVEETPEVIKEDPVVIVAPIIVIEEPETVIETPVVVEEVKPVIIEEPIVIKEPVAPKPSVVEKIVDKPTDLFGSGPSTIADKFKGETKTIMDKLNKANADKTISSKHQQHAIKDLKAAIGINEKFLFINELFKGNMKEFNDCIIMLNDFTSLAEAEACFQQYKDKYNWADDLVSFLILKDFIVRRYM